MSGQRRTLGAAIAAFAVAVTSLSEAQTKPDDLPPPPDIGETDSSDAIGVDPYARDPNAPETAADLARGWDVRPQRARRKALIWAEKKARRGAQFTLQAVLSPVKGALTLNQRFEVARRVEELFYNDERTIGVLPSLSFLSGFGASIGGSAFHKNLLGNAETLKLKLEYGGKFGQMFQLSLDVPQIASERFYVETLARYDREAELFFYGLGHPPDESMPIAGLDPRAASVETQFLESRALGFLGAGVIFGHQGLRLRTGLSAVYSIRDYAPLDAGDDDTSLDDVYDTSLVAGFDDGEDILELTFDAILDTRDRAGNTGAGLLVDGFVGGAPSVDGNLYLHYGAEASYFLTVFRRGRVLLFRAMLEGVEGDEEAIPFSELPRIGGKRRLRGYRRDRFRDNLAAIGTLEYRYPIHFFASGVFFVDAGRVARTYPDLVSAEHWQPGFGGGVVLHTLDDVSLRLDLSYGEGFEVFLSTDALRAFKGRRRDL